MGKSFALVDRPGLRNVELLEQADGVAVGHAGDKIAGGGVEALAFDRARVEKRGRLLANLLPQAGQNAGGFLELDRCDAVLVHGVEQETPQLQHRIEHPVTHANLRQPAGQRLGYDIRHQRANASRRRAAEDLDGAGRQILGREEPGPRRIVDVVVDVGDEIGHAHDLAFDRARTEIRRHADRRAGLSFRVLGDAVPHFPRQVEAGAVVLQRVDDPQTLLVVIEAAGHERVDHSFTGMAERRVTEVVTKRNRFGQLLVQPEHLGDCARDLRHLQRVRQTGAIVIAGGREEYLRLVFEAAKCLAVNDPVAIALESRPDVVFPFGAKTSPGVGALGCLRREYLPLTRLQLLSQGHRGHGAISARKLVPWASRPAPNRSLSDWPRSANVRRVPTSMPARTREPTTSSGTYSREWSVLGVVGSLPWSAVTTSRSSGRRRGRTRASR